jgi:S1-C subfamily serine protease
VTRVDGQPVESARSFFERLETATDGQQLELELWREGQSRRVPLRAEEVSEALIAKLLEELTGMQLEADRDGGFRVSAVRSGSGAERIGMQAGDQLLGINGRALVGPAELRRAVLTLRGQARALIVVQRGQGRYHVAIPLT